MTWLLLFGGAFVAGIVALLTIEATLAAVAFISARR